MGSLVSKRWGGHEILLAMADTCTHVTQFHKEINGVPFVLYYLCLCYMYMPNVGRLSSLSLLNFMLFILFSFIYIAYMLCSSWTCNPWWEWTNINVEKKTSSIKFSPETLIVPAVYPKMHCKNLSESYKAKNSKSEIIRMKKNTNKQTERSSNVCVCYS